MSSFFGHSFTAWSIYSLTKQPKPRSFSQLLWLLWLTIVACAPDVDYLIKALHSSNHQGLRITHSFLFSLILPCVTILFLIGWGLRGKELLIYSVQLTLAALSHLVLDLLVGVTPLPLFWFISEQKFRLSFGILPSAGRINLHNYYFYRNLWIEMGVLVPLFASLYIIRYTSVIKLKQVIIAILMISISIYFMHWAYYLPR